MATSSITANFYTDDPKAVFTTQVRKAARQLGVALANHSEISMLLST